VPEIDRRRVGAGKTPPDFVTAAVSLSVSEQFETGASAL
jgi:hypothetical protein